MTDPVTDYDVVVFNASIFLCVMAVFMVKDIEKMMNLVAHDKKCDGGRISFMT